MNCESLIQHLQSLKGTLPKLPLGVQGTTNNERTVAFVSKVARQNIITPDPRFDSVCVPFPSVTEDIEPWVVCMMNRLVDIPTTWPELESWFEEEVKKMKDPFWVYVRKAEFGNAVYEILHKKK